MKITNPKHQITNKSQITNSKFKISFCSAKKFVLNIGILIFGIVWYLGFVVWNLYIPRGIDQLREVWY